MKKRLSRILSLVLLVAMVMSLMPTTLAFAEEAPAEEITVPEEGVILPVAGENDPPADDPEDPFYEDELFYEDDFEDELFYEDDLDAVTDEADDLLADSETSTWVKIDYDDITADDQVAVSILVNTGNTYYFIPAVEASSSPKAKAVETTIDTISTDSLGEEFGWTVSKADTTFTLGTGSNYLSYSGTSTTGVRVDTTETKWQLLDDTANSVTRLQDSETERFIVYYGANNEFRAYKYASNNLTNNKNQDLQFWKLTDGGDTPVEPEDPTEVAAPTASPAGGAVDIGADIAFDCATSGAVIYYCYSGDENRWVEGDSFTVPENAPSEFNIQLQAIYYPTDGDPISSAVNQYNYTIRTEAAISTIAEALAGADNAEFTVKGVVTLLDAKNVFVQDATGGICLRLSAAPTDLALGDTVIGTGKKSVYKGLPQLNGTYEKSEGLTLSAKETTLDAITEADVCTYVKINGLTVKEINGDNTVVTDASGKEMPIYKAKTTETLKAGDTLDFTGAVGIFNTLQLRNTLASEITVTASATPDDPTPEDPYAGIDKDLNVYQLTDTIRTGDRVLIYNAGNGKSLTGTILKNYYLTGTELAKLEGYEGVIATNAEAVEWIVTADEDGSYSFAQGDKVLAGKQIVNGSKTNNNFTLSPDDNTHWVLTQASTENASYYLYNKDMTSKYSGEGGHIYVEWYAQYTEFSLYDTSRVSEPNFGFTFYKLVREAETEKPEAPVATPQSGMVDAGTQVRISCPTEGAIIYTSIDGETWTNTTDFTINETMTIQAYAEKDQVRSDVVSFTYTVKSTDRPEGPYWELIGGADAMGSIKANDIVTVTMTVPDNSEQITYALSNANGDSKAPAAVQATVNGDWMTLNGNVKNSSVSWNIKAETGGYGIYTTDGKAWLYTTDANNGVRVGADAAKVWTVSDGYLKHVGTGRVMGVYWVNVYNGTSTPVDNPDWRAYKNINNNIKDETLQFWKLMNADAETPDDPTPGEGETYGLVSNLNDGDEVIIYNAGNSKAVGNTLSGYNAAAVDLMPADGVITTANTDVVWTVSYDANTDTYQFKQGNKTLSGEQVTKETENGPTTYNNIGFDKAASGWTLETKDANDFTYTLYLGALPSAKTENNGHVYLEYYNGFTLADWYNPAKKAYGFTFYKKGAEPETPSGGTTDGPVNFGVGTLVTSLDQLTDGATVLIYNPYSRTAASAMAYGGWNLKAAQAEEPRFTDDMVWTVGVQDGVYTFTGKSFSDGDHELVVWLGDKNERGVAYAELVSDPTYDIGGKESTKATPHRKKIVRSR